MSLLCAPSCAIVYHKRLSTLKLKLELELPVIVELPEVAALKCSVRDFATATVYSFVDGVAGEIQSQVR